MATKQPNVTRWLDLIQAEYLEMPGLTLTKAQVCGFWCLDAAACDALLERLVDARFLAKTRRESYLLTGATQY